MGTDSHTTMVNGLGVIGWGVGGIEAEAAMLGQPVSMLIPRVVGFKLSGELPEGVTATDLVLTITEMLRKHGVVGKFVEFYGPGVAAVPLANRATIGNMSPEYGSTVAVFPVDDETMSYLRLTGRPDSQLALVEAYAKEQGIWHDADREPATRSISSSISRPSCRRSPVRSGPQDRVALSDAKAGFRSVLGEYVGDARGAGNEQGVRPSIGRVVPGQRPALVHRREQLGPPARTGCRRHRRRRDRVSKPTPVTLADGTSSSSTTAPSPSRPSRRARTPPTRR